MAVLHFEQTPFKRNLFGVSEEEVQGKFDGWQKKATYIVRLNVVLQVDTTNVSDKEYSVAPNITFLSTNQAIVNIFKTFEFEGSFQEFNEWYGGQESSLQYYIDDLVSRLNSARRQAGLMGSWYVNYGLDDRDVEVHRP